MSEGERVLADDRGKVMYAVKNGRKLTDAEWQPARLVLSNKRLVLGTNDGKTTIPLSDVQDVGGRRDVNQAAASVSDYLRVSLDGTVVLVAAGDQDSFRTALFEALLEEQVLTVRHPAVKGGVVQDTEWERCRLSIEPERVGIAMASGSFLEVVLDDVGGLEETDMEVDGSRQAVIDIEHAEGTTSVRTQISGSERHCRFLESLFADGEARNTAELDLSGTEQQILMALYSGVTPFGVPDFLGLDVETVEETYARLVDLDVLDEVRMRREVALTTRGRNVASEAINDGE